MCDIPVNEKLSPAMLCTIYSKEKKNERKLMQIHKKVRRFYFFLFRIKYRQFNNNQRFEYFVLWTSMQEGA